MQGFAVFIYPSRESAGAHHSHSRQLSRARLPPGRKLVLVAYATYIRRLNIERKERETVWCVALEHSLRGPRYFALARAALSMLPQ